LPLIRAELQRRRLPRPGPLIHDLSQVLYLPFDKDDGSYARDRSGYGNHGTIYGATRVTGKIGGALDFDGVDDNVLCPDIGNFDELTVMAWIKGKTLKSYAMIVTKDDTGGLDIPFNFGMYGTSAKLRFAAYIGGVWGDHQFDTVLAEDVWYHVAITYDGSTKKAYVNSVKEPSEFSASGSITGTDRVMVAARKYTAPEYFWDGIIDEARIYNKALTEVEIARLMYLRGI